MYIFDHVFASVRAQTSDQRVNASIPTFTSYIKQRDTRSCARRLRYLQERKAELVRAIDNLHKIVRYRACTYKYIMHSGEGPRQTP